MNQRNFIISYLLLVIGLCLPMAGQAKEEDGVVGDLHYVAFTEQKELYIEMPLDVQFQLTKITSGYWLTALGSFSAVDRSSDLEAVRSQHRGYKVRRIQPARFTSIEVNLGLEKKMALAIPPQGASGFSGNLKLTNEEGENLKRRFESGEGPVVLVQTLASVPRFEALESIDVDLSKACRKIEMDSNSATLSDAIAEAAVVLVPDLNKIVHGELKRKTLFRFFDLCFEIEVPQVGSQSLAEIFGLRVVKAVKVPSDQNRIEIGSIVAKSEQKSWKVVTHVEVK